MDEFVANFNLDRQEFEANFDLEQPVEFDAVFEINPAGATWGGITGTLANQTDLKNELDTLSGQIDSNHQAITEINTTIQGYGDIVTYNASDFATSTQGLLADTALQPNDNITLLNNNAGYITNAVNNLTNYYLKSETYTKTEVQQLIASIPQFSVQIVQTLPVTGERMVLYLVPKDGEAPDVYNEYIWVEDEDEFELLGSTAVDLDGYATEVWVQNQGYATETYVNNGLATKQDTLTAGTGISIVNNVISNTQTSAEWGNIQGTLSNQTDLQNALNAKLNVSDVTEYTAQEVETLWGSIQ